MKAWPQRGQPILGDRPAAVPWDIEPDAHRCGKTASSPVEGQRAEVAEFDPVRHQPGIEATSRCV